MSDIEQLERLMGRMVLDSVISTLVAEATRRLDEVYKHLPPTFHEGSDKAWILYNTAADLMADEMWLEGVPLVQRLWSDYMP